MRRFLLSVALLAALPTLAAQDAPAPAKPRTTLEVLDASAPSDWRSLDPANTLYLDLAAGRVVLDTALPWLAIHPIERMPGHVYSFIHALERLNVTVLLTLPWPASTPAFMLKNRLEDICPVVFIVQKADDSSDSFFKVAKYLGDNLSTTTPIAFKMHGMKSGERVLDSEIPAAAANPAARVPYVATPFEQAGSAPGVPYSPPSSPQLRAVPPSRQQAPQAAPLPPAGDDRPITFSSVIDL